MDEILTLARRFFPAMARAIKEKVDAFFEGNPVFDTEPLASATAQDRHVLSDTEVITGQAPTRYALALLDLAEEAKSLPRVEKDLKSFKKMYQTSADLKRLAESPVFSTEDKVAALTAVAKKAKLSPLTTQFIGTVAGNRRAADLPGIISAFNEMVARRRGSQVAKVTSAAKLTAAEMSAIKSQLKKSLGRPVDVETSVDPELLGGFVVRIGSRLYDSSLKTKLEDLRLALKEA